MTNLKIVNLVASLDLMIKINLNLLMEKNPGVNIEYEPSQFPALIYNIQKPKASFLIFSNGQIICTGTKNLKIAKEAMKKLKDKITL